MSLTISHSPSLAPSALPRPTEPTKKTRATIALAALFLALFAAELAVVVALAPSIDALSALAPVD
jgi:hypothetical protein